MTYFRNVSSISWRAVRWLLLFYVLTLLAAGSLFRVYIHKQIDSESSWVPEFLSQLDQNLVYAFWVLAFVGFMFSLAFVVVFFSPLSTLIDKSRSLKKGQYNLKDQKVIKESNGEWYQLDLALNKVSKELKRQKADVARERGELEAVLTAANDAILAVDRDMNIRYYNTPMALFFDQREEGNWGRKLQEVVRNHHIIEAFQKSLSEQKPQSVQTAQELAIDSSLHYFQVSVSPFLDEKKNRTRGAVAIFHDITEHKKIEKVRMDFVANASHELKTPLTSIQGYMDFIKDSCKEKENLNEAFKVVENNISRLNRLISDLLELSKIESREAVLFDDLETEVLTEAVLYDLQGKISEKEHKITTLFDAQKVKSNGDLMEHVLINLIENAVKYCPNQSDIKIHWGQKNDHVFLSVKDNGPGVESYHQGRLFERFYRVRDEQNQTTKGTGLGLSIVRNCMQKLGGHVDVKSAPGLGSEFICYFPLK